jgi:hypothetical protein
MLQVHVLAFVPAQLAQPLTEGGNAAAAELRREETEQAKPGDFSCLLRLGDGDRRETEAESENNREPDQPHEHLGGGWLAGV